MYTRSLIFRFRFFIFVMMNHIYILIIGFVILFGSLNTILYFYFKYRRKILFNFLQTKDYILVEKVETDIERYSKIGNKFFYRKSDIVFFEDEIFIISYTYNKPIIQIGNGEKKFPGVFQKWNYEFKSKINNRLEIKGIYHDSWIDGNYKIYLNLKNKNFDLEGYVNQPKK